MALNPLLKEMLGMHEEHDPAKALREHLSYLVDGRDYIAKLEADILLAKTNARAVKAEARAAKEEVRAMKMEASLAKAKQSRAYFIETLPEIANMAGVSIVNAEADPDTILSDFETFEANKKAVAA